MDQSTGNRDAHEAMRIIEGLKVKPYMSTRDSGYMDTSPGYNIYIHTYIHTHTHTYTHTNTYTHTTHTHTHIHIQAYAHTHVHNHTYTYTHACITTYINKLLKAYAAAHTDIRMHIDI